MVQIIFEFVNFFVKLFFLCKFFVKFDNIYYFLGLRLLGIGRNEYIELMNRSRSSRGKLFGKKNVKVLLPPVPCDINIEPWWRVEVGLVLESDIKVGFFNYRILLNKTYLEKFNIIF